MSECVYFWYHHMGLTSEERNHIHKVIEDHDFDEFMRLYNKLNDGRLTYLPDTAAGHDENGEFYNLDILTRENFDKITDNECECG